MIQFHQQWIREAILLATENVRFGRGGPFGAVVVRENQIIATGVNLVGATNDPTAHAEVAAIRAACQVLGTYQLEGCSVYSSCEPCPMCLGAIYWARPESYYFAATRKEAAGAGFDDEFIYRELALEPAQRMITGRRIVVPESSDPFTEWERSANKIRY